MSLPNSSLNSSSRIKQVAFNLMQKFDKLAQPRINHQLIRWFWNKFFLSHAHSAISQMSDFELKRDLFEGYLELKEIFEAEKLGEEIKEYEKLNSGKSLEFVKSIKENKEALELIPDGINL